MDKGWRSTTNHLWRPDHEGLWVELFASAKAFPFSVKESHRADISERRASSIARELERELSFSSHRTASITTCDILEQESSLLQPAPPRLAPSPSTPVTSVPIQVSNDGVFKSTVAILAKGSDRMWHVFLKGSGRAKKNIGAVMHVIDGAQASAFWLVCMNERGIKWRYEFRQQPSARQTPLPNTQPRLSSRVAVLFVC